MKTWEITISNRTIKVNGKTLENAVARWGKRQKNNTSVSCGLLVRVKNPDGRFSYWSGQRFLECLG